MVQKIKQRLIMENVQDFDIVKGASIGGGDFFPATNVALTDEAMRMVRHTRLTITDLVISVTAALDYGGTKICDLPDSNLVLVGAELNLTTVTKDGTGIVDASVIPIAVGTAVASNATLSGAMVDVLDSKALAGVNPTTHVAHGNDNAAPAINFLDDGATQALWMNAAIALTADGTLTVSGTLDLFYLDTGNVSS